MAETDPGELADDLEREADDLEEQSERLGRRTEEVSQDWQRKRSDQGVPGAPPPTDDQEESKDDDAGKDADAAP